jgi:hypothetical protein
MREVALGTPSLWTFIECRSTKQSGEWEELCFKRAQNCLLDISGPGHYITDNSIPKERFVDLYAQRARRMCFTYSGARVGLASYRKFLRAILSAPLPVIQGFRCNMHSTELPLQFLGGGSPSLTYLSLLKVYLSDTDCAPDLPALRYLELELGHTLTNIRARQLVALLKQTPIIETLIVRMPHSLGEVTTSQSFNPVSLPKLRTVHMDGGPEDVSLLARIIPTPGNDLFINIDHGTGTTGKLSPDTHQYLLRFLEDANRTKWRYFMGHIHLSDETGRFEFGNKFEPNTDAPFGDPRVYFCHPYRAGRGLVPDDLLDKTYSVSISGDWEDSERTAFTDLGRDVYEINVEGIDSRESLPLDMEDWISRRAWRLDSVNFTRCREGGVGGLLDYANELEDEGMAKWVRWTD